MRTLMALLAVSLCAQAALVDLGVISPRKSVILSERSERPDFSHFQIETHGTNRIALTVTNELLTLADLMRLPSGRSVLWIQSVYGDGSRSKPVPYAVFLARGEPPAPSATPVSILTTNEPDRSTTREMRRIKGAATILPPMPTLPGVQRQAQVQPPKPLPGGTNRAYAEHLDWLETREGKRRNE